MSAAAVAGDGLRFNLCRVEGTRGSARYEEAVTQLYCSLVDLGHECTVSYGSAVAGGVNIVIGWLVLAWPDRERLLPGIRDGRFVVHQMEQLHESRRIYRDHRAAWADLFSRAAAIWEYAPSGMKFFSASPWADKAHYIPPMFHRALETFAPAPDPTIDVLFCGTLSERRVGMLRTLIDRGVRLVALQDAYGAARDAEISTTKIVLNIHASDADVLETLRVAHLLANRCFVVCETSDHDPFDGGLVYADCDRLADACLAYLDRPTDRAAIADKGYAAVRRHDMPANLRAAIAKLPLAELTSP